MSTQILTQTRADGRTVCPECSKSITAKSLYVLVNERRVHVYCASDAGKVEACPECFTIGGQCACSTY